jgi:hypothetical protein
MYVISVYSLILGYQRFMSTTVNNYIFFSNAIDRRNKLVDLLILICSVYVVKKP